MRKNSVVDPEVQRLLNDARCAAYEMAPRPSVALTTKLALPVAVPDGSLVMAELTDSPRIESAGITPAHRSRTVALRNGVKKMIGSFAGLGIAAKIAAATGVLALGLTGVGAAGALPGPAQDAFDGVVSSFVPTDEETVDDGSADDCVVDDGTVDDGTVDDGTVDDDTTGTDDTTDTCASDAGELPVGSKEFSAWVVQGAQDPNKVGSEFGAAVSEQARELKNENAAERAANGGIGNGNGGDPVDNGDPVDSGDDADDDGDSAGDDETVNDPSTERGNSAGQPGGRP